MSGTAINDGGPAFPIPDMPLNSGEWLSSYMPTSSGMSLRAWLAGKALANPAICHSELHAHQRVQYAIEHADLMIELLFKKE